jgi:hypothetical protein
MDQEKQILSGTSTALRILPILCFIYLPGTYPWIQGHYLDHDEGDYSYALPTLTSLHSGGISKEQKRFPGRSTG